MDIQTDPTEEQEPEQEHFESMVSSSSTIVPPTPEPSTSKELPSDAPLAYDQVTGPCGRHLLLLSSLIFQYRRFHFFGFFHLCSEIQGPKLPFFFSLYRLVPQPFLFMLRYFFFISVCVYRLMYCS